ncbi:MAG: dTDP-4-dehydrorhamnose 3,5-epimerase family protein [Bacteroidales bacterium]|nr:dTDP-4-dehydrorhamnose 3,5-epimerase family protein [Bacteroidales bacterium]
MDLFTLNPTGIDGCLEIIPRIFEDNRGRFIKLFHQDFFRDHELISTFEEEYYSISSQHVLRGLHFQIPPNAHVKLVCCLRGSILDVVVDLRKKSNTYKKVNALEINAEKGNMLYVPEGMAHGFYVTSKECLFLSMNSKKFSPECDFAIRWDSVDYRWPDMNPVVSVKDHNAVSIEHFESPF